MRSYDSPPLRPLRTSVSTVRSASCPQPSPVFPGIPRHLLAEQKKVRPSQSRRGGFDAFRLWKQTTGSAPGDGPVRPNQKVKNVMINPGDLLVFVCAVGIVLTYVACLRNYIKSAEAENPNHS